MRAHLFIILLLSTTLFCRAGTLPEGFQESLVAKDLDPTDMVLTPDGRIFITIKSGKVLIVEDGVLRASPLINLEESVDNYNERGLGHIVLDPDFESNGYYYLYYTVEGENHNRVSRFTAIGNFSDPESKEVLLDFDQLAGTIHNAGDMVFGPNDGKLYISVGDGADGSTSQSLTSLLGKILRINSDGTIPTDNPFDDLTTGKYKAIWALGFRNPFSMDVQPGTGKIFACDVGGSDWEEVNYVEAGGNYGWPGIEGTRTSEAIPSIGTYHDPFYAYPHGNGIDEGCSIVGAAFYNPEINQFPDNYLGQFFFADYCNGYIKYANPEDGSDVAVFATDIDRPLAITISPDGSMYYIARAGQGGGSQNDNTSSSNGTLWKVVYTGSGAPFVSIHPQNVTIPVGEDATFNIQATGSAPLSYQWLVDETEIGGATSNTYSYINAQLGDDGKQVSCRVSNTEGIAVSNFATLTVTENTRPIAQISWSLPQGDTLYQGGQVLTFSGSASDGEDGDLTASALTWKIDFHHDEHHHPALSDLPGVTGSTYLIPKVGETSTNVWYRLWLTAVDNGDPALTNTTYQDVFPLTSQTTVVTIPPNLVLFLDGQSVIAPHTFPGVVNTTRSLQAPGTQIVDSKLYGFESWSDENKDLTLSFDSPPEDSTITASFSEVEVGQGEGLIGYYYSNQDRLFIDPPTLVRLDPIVDFDWGDGAPDPKISTDNFTVRWLGELLPQFSDIYTFFATADDGVRLWVADSLIIDQWIDQPSTEWSGVIALESNQKYPIQLEYYENGGGAVIRLEWSSTLLTRQVIPTLQLSSDFLTGIENDNDGNFRLYPTIAEHEIFIAGNFLASSKWVISNLQGIEVMSGEAPTSFTLNVGSLPPNLYFFRIGSRTYRFVKK